MLWVSFTQVSSFLVSSILFTGSRFGFLFPLCFLFRFSSPKLGDNSSFFESHLYPSNFLVLLSVLTFSKGFSPHCKFQRKLPSFQNFLDCFNLLFLPSKVLSHDSKSSTYLFSQRGLYTFRNSSANI